MKKYQQLAEQLREQIASGIWQPGDRLPSLRDQVALSGMSFMTVSHAYQLLESQGYIIARPQSGYYVAPQAIKMPKAPVIPVTRDEAVDINTYIFDMLQASRDASVMPFASAFPDPRLFPLQQLNRSLAQVSKTATAMSVIENLPPGNAELRHAIARRYALQGMNVSPDEIVITAGALEALRWALQLGVPHVLIADALADAVRTIGRVAAVGRSDPFRLAGELGMPPWKVKKALAQSRGWNSATLSEALQVVAEVNADVKGVAADAGYALERAVRRLLDLRNSRSER